MPRRGENIYKRKDGRWEARVIKGYDEHGKALYAYFYGRTYKEVKEKIFTPHSFIKNNGIPTVHMPIAAGGIAVGCASEEMMRFGVVLDSWLERKKIGLKESSHVKYFNLINNHIKPSLGDYTLSGINSATLNSYITDKHKFGKVSKQGVATGLSEKTLKDIVVVIKSALRFAKDEGLLSYFTPINVVMPREKSKDMRVLSKDEQATLEKFLCNDIDLSKLGILLCLYTGLRIGEAYVK